MCYYNKVNSSIISDIIVEANHSFIFDDLIRAVHGPDIISQSACRNKPINIDQNITLNKKILLKVNKKNKEYKKNFIKHPKSDEKNT